MDHRIIITYFLIERLRGNHHTKKPKIPPNTIYKIGEDKKPISNDIINATTHGIHTVFHLRFAAFAEVRTGAIIKATTAGRIPINIDDSIRLLFIVSGVRNIAISNIMRKEGSIVPKEAMIEPLFPRTLSPTAVAILTARMPGKD